MADVAEEPINVQAVAKSGVCLPVGRWMLDPCCVCGRELADTEGRYGDWLAQTVKCDQCYHQPLIDALRVFDGQEAGDV